MRPDALVALEERRWRVKASHHAIGVLLWTQSVAIIVCALPMIGLPIKVGLATFAISTAFAVSRGVAWLCRGYLADMAVRTLLAQEARQLTAWHRFLDNERERICEQSKWTQILYDRAQRMRGGSRSG